MKTLIPLSIVCALLIGFSYTQSAWTEPLAGTVAATNVEPPINTSSASQVKPGALGVDAMAVFGDVDVDGILTASTSVWSRQYCDENGGNCFNAASTSPTLTIGLINIESSANTMVAHSACQSAGYLGFWSGMDHSGTEDILCFNITGMSASIPGAVSLNDGYSIRDLVKSNNPSLSLADAVYGGTAEQNAVCNLLLPGSAVSSRVTGTFYSPRDNNVYKLVSGVWTRVNANGNNLKLDRISCIK